MFLIYKLARNYTTKSATNLIIDKKKSNSANKNTSIVSLEYASQIISDKQWIKQSYIELFMNSQIISTVRRPENNKLNHQVPRIKIASSCNYDTQ